MNVQPYLCYEGRCEEALEFYKEKLGATVEMMMRFKESPDPSHNPPGSDEKVMHVSFKVGETRLMASDGHCTGKPEFKGISLSLSVDDVDDAKKYFDALSDGGRIEMPLTETFFSPSFGMVEDKFGVMWMVLAYSETM